MLGYLRGQSGELRAGYQPAAKLGRWTGRKDKKTGTWTIEADIEDIHPLWICHEPLMAALFFGNGIRWRWHNAKVLNQDGKLLFQVSGDPEK